MFGDLTSIENNPLLLFPPHGTQQKGASCRYSGSCARMYFANLSMFLPVRCLLNRLPFKLWVHGIEVLSFTELRGPLFDVEKFKSGVTDKCRGIHHPQKSTQPYRPTCWWHNNCWNVDFHIEQEQSIKREIHLEEQPIRSTEAGSPKRWSILVRSIGQSTG